MGHRRGPGGRSTDGRVIHWARAYDSVVRVATLGRERAVREQTVRLASLRPGARVLDVGCGTGTLLVAAARAEPTIEARGIDPAAEMIARARQKAEAAGVRASFEVGVVEALRVEDESMDVVLSSLMLHHLPPRTLRQGLAEIHRVLAPGGRFVAVDLAGPGPLFHRVAALAGRIHRHVHGQGRGQGHRHGEGLVDQVRAAGFVGVERGPMNPRYLFSLTALKPT